MDTHSTPVRHTLIVVAAPIEARAVLAGILARADSDTFDWLPRKLAAHTSLLMTGVGKTNAAGAVARAWDPNKYHSVLNVGIAGALPDSELALGQSVLASHSAFADEGVLTDAGYRTIAQMGFALGPPPVNDARVAGHPRLLAALTPLVDTLAAIATVSTCSGTDALARIVRDRTGAAAECMEGAAIALVCARLGAPFAELRTISNTTGDRSGQRWDIAGALARLSSILGRIDWPSLGG